MASAFNKELGRSIRHSLGRFLAIAVIAALGTGFFAGLQMTAPDMKMAGDEYYDGTNLCDIRVMSTLGLSDDEVETLSQVEGVEGVMPAYETDSIAVIDGQQCTVRIHSLDMKAAEASDISDGKSAKSDDVNYINRPLLVEGTWPNAPDECLIAADAVMDSNVSVGDTIELTEGVSDLDDTLVTKTFTIVGTARTPYYTSALTIGSTSLGTGSIEQFMFVPEEAFDEDLPYTEAFITVTGAKDFASASDEYDEYIQVVEDRIHAVAPEIQSQRLAGIKAEAQKTLDENKADFDEQKQDANKQLADAKKELDSAHGELTDAKSQLDDSSLTLSQAKQDLGAAQSEIQVNEQNLNNGLAEYNAGVAELESQRQSAETQFADAEQQLADGQTQYDEAMATREQLVVQKGDLQAQLDQVIAGQEQVEAGLAQAQQGLDAVDAALGALVPEMPGYEETLSGLTAQKEQLEQTIKGLQAQQTQLHEAAASIQGGLTAIDDGINQIDAQTAGVKEQLAQAHDELKNKREEAAAGFADAEAQLAFAKQTIDDGFIQLANGKQQLAQGQADYQNGLNQYNDGLAQYEDGLAQYKDGLAEYNDKKAEADDKFADAQAEIDDAQADIDGIELPDVYVLDRSKNMGVQSFFSDADRIHQIAQVFPFIFFLVAALVSLTTMTRMVEEERVLIGTYKALGYSNMRITSKYLIYAIVASGVGSLIGILGLSQFLPWFIMNAYGIVYAVPVRPTPIDLGITTFSLLLGVGITVAATWAAVGSTLRERPAQLMLPRAPKAGKRILIERITPLWNRMSFLWKVTARNIFRYKRRFFMAIIGVAGCTALLLTGLGLQNAINDIIDKQFGELYHYTMVVSAQDDATDEERADIESTLAHDALVEGFTHVGSYNMLACQEGSPDQLFTMLVPEDKDEFANYVTWRERESQDPLQLTDDGVLVSEKMADMYNLKVGDTLQVFEQDSIGNATGDGYDLPITGITEHYVNQYVYMTPEFFEETFGGSPEFLTTFAKAGENGDDRSDLSDALLAKDSVKTVGFNDETIDTYRTMLKSVDAVVVVLVVAAALLAFVVLYNLTNINITERQREIATLKVLGFTPHEVNAYIYRETILLSMIGAAVGLVLGIFMEGFVVTTAEVDMVMFGREIHALSFVIAFFLTMLFSIFVSFTARRKLDKIDMVESLKSIE